MLSCYNKAIQEMSLHKLNEKRVLQKRGAGSWFGMAKCRVPQSLRQAAGTTSAVEWMPAVMNILIRNASIWKSTWIADRLVVGWIDRVMLIPSLNQNTHKLPTLRQNVSPTISTIVMSPLLHFVLHVTNMLFGNLESTDWLNAWMNDCLQIYCIEVNAIELP